MEKMVTVIFVFLLLNLPVLFGCWTGSRCFWKTKLREKNGDMQNEFVFYLDIVMAPMPTGFFKNILESRWPPETLQHVLTLAFASEEMNSKSNLLVNMSLLWNYHEWSLRNFLIFTLLNGLQTFTVSYFPDICEEPKLTIALTGPSWKTSAKLGPLLGLTMTPQIHYGSFHPILSDQDKFPHLYQVAPKDTILPLAMVSLMLRFSWTWVGLVISDDDRGLQFLSDLRAEMQRNGICLAFVNEIPENMELYRTKHEMYEERILSSSAHVVVIYGEMDSTLAVSFRRWEVLGIRRIWVTTSQWDVSTSKGASVPDSFHGRVTFSHHHGEISNFKSFIQTLNFSQDSEDFSWIKLGWVYFNCSLSQSYCKTLDNCFSNTSVEWLPRHSFNVAMNDESYNMYNAVYAVAHALHEMILQGVDRLNMENNLIQTLPRKQLYAFLRNLQFMNPIGDVVSMNHNGQLTEYDIFNILDFHQDLGLKIKIGEFSPSFPHGQHIYLSEDMLQWTTESKQIPPSVCSVPCSPGFRKSHQEGHAACCFDCCRCSQNEISNETGEVSLVQANLELTLEPQAAFKTMQFSYLSLIGAGIKDTEQCVRCPDDQYANLEQNHCLQKSKTYLSYGDPLGMALACLALCFSALAAAVLGVFWKHQDTPIVKANNRSLSYILLISLTFCFLCSLLFIGHPNTATCILQQTTFGVLFTVAVSTVLAKTVTVVLAFTVTTPGRWMRKLLISGAPNFIIPTCTLIQLILCGVWLGTSPPFVDADPHSEHGYIIVMCNKGSVTAFYCILGYLGSLAMVSFTVAFLARNLPDTFNEAKFLTFSMLVFCCVWVTFLPVYQSSKGKFMVAVEVFSILASSAGLLGCIFVPKCYIILLRPERNCLHKLRDKTES